MEKISLLKLTFILTINVFFFGECVILDRKQLEQWYPDFMTSNNLPLGSRYITNVSNDTFAGLAQLQILFLTSNSITKLDDPTMLSDLKELWYFSASYNQISYIHPDMFSGLTKLSTLYFEGNQLTTLDSSLFSKLNLLFLLRLDGNQLTSLDDVIFSQNKQMWTLMLQDNNISQIDPNVFVGLDNLEKVYLGSNPISLKQPDFVKKLCSTNPKCKIIL